MIKMKFKLSWRITLIVAIIGAIFSFYDRFLKNEIGVIFLIFNLLICALAFFLVIMTNYLSTVINTDCISVIGPRIKALKIKPFNIDYKNITQISPTIYPIWWPAKTVAISGIGSNGKEISIMISNFHTNFKEALIFIKNHVEEDVIEETLLRYIKRCEAKNNNI